MTWKVNIDRHAIKQLKKLDKPAQKRVTDFLKSKIADCCNPRHTGKPLQGKLAGLWRYRVGDYRIICKLKDSEVTVLVLNIKHRKHVYS